MDIERLRCELDTVVYCRNIRVELDIYHFVIERPEAGSDRRVRQYLDIERLRCELDIESVVADMAVDNLVIER